MVDDANRSPSRSRRCPPPIDPPPRTPATNPVNSFRLPFFTRLKRARRILIAGAGGGFDVFSGLPLYFNLKSAGKQVFLANLSFSNLPPNSAGRELTPYLVELTADSQGS